ncbi:protein kinase domain-containing protein [Acidaminobacter hydrogenoformans]|uniref:non-specific serine/threonine protein kinase n=1 Tax=Acidaminobacter hydrogenoformans DSM 2784 TaxID=1120920 RepID=A0A1G5S4P8_9FIRM|nr:protein kinase family protein [Acidaminobacter hydrogenoformans]SCZ80721.1 Protein kinase domain-containing protein [Acidaminobacter hydrogenoformans DSM 2784]
MKGNHEVVARQESSIKAEVSKFHPGDVARGGSCAVYCVRSLEGRGKRCIKRYENPPSRDYLEILELMRAPRGMNVPVVFNWSVSGHRSDELVVEEEWVEGCTLRGLMSEAPQKVVLNAVRWSLQLATTLSRLHEVYGFLHHDIKPENVIIDLFDDAVLIDFDAARHLIREGDEKPVLAQSSDRIGESPALRGTLGYASPEAKLFPGHCDAAVDLYGFGKMFLEIAAIEPHAFAPAYFEILRRCTRVDALSRIESAGMLREMLRAMRIK